MERLILAGLSAQEIAEKLKCSARTVDRWFYRAEIDRTSMTDAHRVVDRPPRAEISALREGGMSRPEIAAHYRVSLTVVKRWIREYGIQTSLAPVLRKPRTHLGHVPTDDGMTILERAALILGPRMREDRRGYLLDGRPVHLDTLIAAAGLKMKDADVR